jgi:hypothetical protein
MYEGSARYSLPWIVGDTKQFVGQQPRLSGYDSPGRSHNENRTEFTAGFAAQCIDKALEFLARSIDISQVRSALQPAEQGSTRGRATVRQRVSEDLRTLASLSLLKPREGTDRR